MRGARLLTVARSYIAARRKASSVRSFPSSTIAVPCSRCKCPGPPVSVRAHGVRMAHESVVFYAAAAGWLLWEPLVLCPSCQRQVPWSLIVEVRMSLLNSGGIPITFVERETAARGTPCATKTNLN